MAGGPRYQLSCDAFDIYAESLTALVILWHRNRFNSNMYNATEIKTIAKIK